MHQNNQAGTRHVPVLLDHVLSVLGPKTGDSYLDLTAGYGGHSSAILGKTQAPEKAVLVDRDALAIESLQQQFGDTGAEIVHSDFLAESQKLSQQKREFDLVLADLGVSSPHLDIASRGFSFQKEGPLDMRMDQSQQLSADTIVNHYTESEVADILRRYGEEPKSAKIAGLIVRHRPILSTRELATIVAQAWPGHHKVHPATRTFQALRIVVNDELGMLERSLPLWADMLAPGGRMAVISFHSLEDRVVKQFLLDRAGAWYDADLQLVTKRPLTGDKNEIVHNPRARSAKLRAAVKIKNKRKGSAHADSG